ncbi:MAG: PAS domain S-box protein, partial [Gammaproteobacteria bacterium]|nr:PAS domain S-box protein [Gammaproteobacteria bacterium]NIR96268.1 PAS domain S-box protein [Gammaproteobacteria bacterium]NIW49408.1 PAS domain S-box protein [Gammaproteobacteria bacterium]NIX59832.1 PAS domain S-box protein [candidate division Zixibacteria bacterium]
KDELAGQYIEVLIPERYREGHPALRNKYIRSDAGPRSMGANRELMALRKDGSEFPVEIGLGPVLIDDKKHVVATIIDITEKKEQA